MSGGSVAAGRRSCSWIVAGESLEVSVDTVSLTEVISHEGIATALGVGGAGDVLIYATSIIADLRFRTCLLLLLGS